MKTYFTLQTDGMIEDEIKKSRFICQIKRVTSEEEARDFINQVKKTHYKANHNCSTFIIGEGSEIKRSSDDGEPSGTAGVPMLNVLEQHQVTNVVAVVTRYFGGIKLGAGGLIRAYAGAVAHAVKAIGVVQVKELQGLNIQLSYAQYQEWPNFLKAENLQEAQAEFATEVTVTIFVEKEEAEPILARLTDFFHGKISYQKGAMQVVEVPVNTDK